MKGNGQRCFVFLVAVFLLFFGFFVAESRNPEIARGFSKPVFTGVLKENGIIDSNTVILNNTPIPLPHELCDTASLVRDLKIGEKVEVVKNERGTLIFLFPNSSKPMWNCRP